MILLLILLGKEYAFKHLLDEDQIFLLWINKPSIIVGRHQNTIEEINRDYVREHGGLKWFFGSWWWGCLSRFEQPTTPSFQKKMKTKPLTSRVFYSCDKHLGSTWG